MRPLFPLFQSHLDKAHSYWEKIVQPGDHVIDATCGNGHDTLKLCHLALSQAGGSVYGFDNQKQAVVATQKLLETLPPAMQQKCVIEHRCHSTFPENFKMESFKLIVYNLGYLPGGDKVMTTQSSTTIQSLLRAQDLLMHGGVLSVTCYPGHPEGAIEEKTLIEFAQSLSPKEWSCCHHQWVNRCLAPSLLLIQKA